MFPTLKDIQSMYPNVMTVTHHQTLVDDWVQNERDEDEVYPYCHYCIGGALQMALGETEPCNIDDWQTGIFPASDILADTLHYYLQIPYGEDDPCFFPQHKGQDCFTQSGETAYEVADEITRANDRGEFNLAWSWVEFALKFESREINNV